MDGLDARRDPARGEPRPVRRDASSWTCSIRGMSGSARGVVARTSSAARTAASPIAWIWVAMPPAAARATSSASSLRRRSSTRRAAGPPAAAGPARLEVREQAPRSASPSSRRRSTSASRPGPGRPGPRRARRRCAARRPAAVSSASSRRQAWTRTGSRPVSDEVGVRRERVGQVRVGGERPGIVARRRRRATTSSCATSRSARSRGRHGPASGSGR